MEWQLVVPVISGLGTLLAAVIGAQLGVKGKDNQQLARRLWGLPFLLGLVAGLGAEYATWFVVLPKFTHREVNLGFGPLGRIFQSVFMDTFVELPLKVLFVLFVLLAGIAVSYVVSLTLHGCLAISGGKAKQ